MSVNRHVILFGQGTPGRWLLIAALFISTLAWGHGIDLFATVQGNTINGTLQYADHTPVDGAPVRAYAPDGDMIGETQTDTEGRFTIPVTRHCDYRIVGDAGEGHTGTYTVKASELPLLPSPGQENATPAETLEGAQLDARIEQAVARQLAPLREQLFEHDQAIRLRDLLGGIGYVFGLAGIVVLLKHRKGAGS